MSNDFWSTLNKKKREELLKTAQTKASSSNREEITTGDFWSVLNEDKKRELLSSATTDIAPTRTFMQDDDDIAPVKGGNKNSVFKSGGFSDGVDGVGDFFGDLGQTVLGTTADLGLGILKGAGRLVEGVVDLGTYGVAGVADLFGADKFAEKTKKVAQYSATDEWTKGATDYVDQYSVLGNKADMVSEGIGQVGAIILTGGAAGAAGLGTAGATALTTGLTGLSGMGSGMNEAYAMGASDGNAVAYGATVGSIEAVSEMIFGGLGKGFKALGVSKGLTSIDDVFAKKLSNAAAKFITSEAGQKVVGNTLEYAVKSGAEGLEEVISGFGSAIAKDAYLMNGEDEKAFGEILKDENLLEQFVVGSIVSGIAQGGDFISSTKNGRDFVSGLSKNEQTVVDKVYEQRLAEESENRTLSNRDKNKLYERVVAEMKRGYVTTDEIESILGGETYKGYKDLTDKKKTLEERKKAIEEEIKSLVKTPESQFTVEQREKLTSLREEAKGIKEALQNLGIKTAKNNLFNEVNKLTAKDTFLRESYNDLIRQNQALQIDENHYNGTKFADAAKKTIENARKAKASNSIRVRDFVEFSAKYSSVSGTVVDFKDADQINKILEDQLNAKIATLQKSTTAEDKAKLAQVQEMLKDVQDGKIHVNGVKTKDGVAINIKSPNYLNVVLGHEVTHFLEGKNAYEPLQKAIFKYAQHKGDLDGRRSVLEALYENIDGTSVDYELTADLVGDYLFTEYDFIKNLSTEDRNVFQKVYDQIKYMFKLATAGSKEARELEKVMHQFERALRETAEVSQNTQYQLSKDIDKNGNLGYNGNEMYTVSDRFVLEVDKNDRDVFARSLANKTADLKQGEIRTVEIYSDKKVYYFKATGYMQGRMLYSANIDDVYEYRAEKKEYLNGNNSSRQTFGSWSSVLPLDGTGTRSDIHSIENGRTESDVYEVYGESRTRNSTGTQERIGENFRDDPEEVKRVAKALREEYGFAENHPTNEIAPIKEVSSTDDAFFDGENTDVRFSLSKSVEQTKNLIALHNLTADKLSKTMDLGGFPMPSIAVTRTDIPHTNFGDITLVMNKSTIDPKANRKNTVYSADAWTPTVPPTEYKPNDNRLHAISNKIRDLVGGRQVENALDYVAFDPDNVSRDLSQNDGNLANKYRNNNTMKYAFLKDIGTEIQMPTKEGALSRGISNEAIRYFSGKLVNGLQTVEHYQNMSSTDMMNDTELRNAVAEVLNWDILRQFEEGSENYEKLKANPVYKADDLSFSQIDGLLSGVRKYFNYGIEQVVDGKEAKNAINNYFNENNLQDQYETWLDDLFDGVVEKTGIYNNKDIFTPSGNRRTFEQLHLPVTLDNIVKAMASQNGGNTKNVAGFNGVKTLRAGMAERFKSIDDMHKLEGRLQHLTEEEFEAIHDQLSNRMTKIIDSILETAPESSGNIYMRMDSVGETLMEIAESGKYDTDTIIKTVNQYIYNIDESIANDIRTLLYDVAQMPTNMFEAKPERAVGFDEVNAAILPDNADTALRERLENMGITVLTYEKGNDADRLNKLNGLLDEQPDWKFSLSNKGENRTLGGSYRFDGKDFRVKSDEDIAPIGDGVVEDATTTTEAPMPDEIVPMTEEEANALQDEKAKADAKLEGNPKTRKQLHSNIINDIKATFSSGGYDFDDVLSKAKDLSTFSTVDNTPQRVMEKALGYKEGQVLSDLTVNKVAQNETAGVKWLNSFTDRKNGLLAQISKEYNIKPGSKESAAAQMYAEGFYVTESNDIVAYGDAELEADFPNAEVRSNIKGLAKDQRIRQIYDETLEAINKSRTRNAYPEIQKLDNYFLHFRAMEDTFSKLGLPFNPNDIRAKDLPTDLNGVTADLKPGQPFFASAMHRKGKRTSFDLLGGLERYLTSAKNQIYHIDDIQTLRALRNYIADTYGQANGLEGIDALTEEEAQKRIEEVYNSHLSTFAKFLNEEANILAGKTSLIDRGVEGLVGRRFMTFLDTVRKQTGSNMVGYNISSSLTNFLPVAQTLAKSNKFDFLKAFAQTTSNKFGSVFGKGDNFAENSPVMIRRKGADRFYRTPFQKVGDAGYVLMGAVDNISTELIARTKFNELTRKGMSEQQAHIETDKWVSRLMGDRSLGQMPQLYNSKSLGFITQFQLEVRNQLDSQFYDTIQETKVSNEEIENNLVKNAKTAAKITSTFVQLAVAQHLFGKAFESVAGYNPAFDIIEVLSTMFGFDDDEESEDTALDNLEQGFLELLEDLPYTSAFTGGRIPISSALPIKEFVTGKDSYGNEKSRVETLLDVAPYYLLPGGYGQIKKTAQGLNMFSDDHPIAGSYTDSGNLRFPVEDTPWNRIQAGIFGQYASKNAREYFDNDYAPLKEKQIQEYMDVDLPIGDYWKYREGLSGLKTQAEKADYINSLDIADWQKNLLMNNILDRKEDVDMSNYDDYSDWEEFDYAQKNPDKYAFAKSVGGYSAYKTYSDELYDIKADKDEYGKSISGSRKEKVLNYINNLDADYETKIILWKSEYPSDDTYNMDIINYLNNRADLTYEERVTILTELGFTVSGDTVYWD